MASEPASRRTQIIVGASLIAVALLAAGPLWGPGMVNTRGGGDSPFLLQRLHQMTVNLRAGVFPARWMPDAAYGLGYPFFSYYAALPYYLAALLALAGVDLLTALKLTQTLGFIAAALAMYGWMRRVTPNRWAAWLAAVSYTVAPFHLVNVYVRGDSLSEFYAFAFYPLILWGLERVRRSPPRSAGLPAAATALAYAGLALTHNISFLIFTPFALLYLAIQGIEAAARKENRLRSLAVGLLALGLGLLLSAWFWLPAAAELGYAQLGPSVGLSPQDYFHYSQHFRALNLVQGALLFDYSVAPTLTGRSPFAMGLAQAALAGIGLTALIARIARRRAGPDDGFIALGLLIATLMITPLSKPLWDHLPLLPIVQFPWRFLSVQALFAAAATGQIARRPSPAADRCDKAALQRIQERGEAVSKQDQRSPRRPQRLAMGSPVILAAALLIGSTLLPLHPDRLPIGPADVTVERLHLYELFTENIGTTIRYEWLPNTANPRPFTSDALIEPAAPLRAIPLDGASLEATLVEREPARQVWQVQGKGGGIAFPLHYWPGWEARVDGERTAAWPAAGSGLLALNAPPGAHTVVLRLGRTPMRAAAEAASAAMALAVGVIAAFSALRRRPFRAAARPSPAVPATLALLTLAALLALALASRRDFGGEADLTMDFDRMPYLHHNPDGVAMGAARLKGYTLSADTLAPGDTLTVTLEWTDAAEGVAATVRLVSPAAVRRAVLPLAEATAPISPSLPISLSLPPDMPRGLYLIQVQVGERVEYLRPVRAPRGPALPADAPTLARLGPAIRLHRAAVAQPAPGQLAIQLDWSAAYPLAANYAISLRLFDAAGQMRLAFDAQPGYGFLPTSMWRPGERVADRYLLSLPADLPAGGGYRLGIVLYDAATLEPIGQAQAGDFALPLEAPFEAQPTPRQFVLPPLDHPFAVDLGAVRLAGYAIEQDARAVRLTLWWQAEQAPVDDYTVFVHLFDPATEAIITQSDAMPRGGAYPTSWWAAGEVVSETVVLPLADAPAGTYRLALGLYDRTATRLPAIGPDGQRFPDDRIVLPDRVKVGP